MFRMFIRTNRLTDDSETFDVVLCGLEEAGSTRSPGVMDFRAVTYGDAMDLMLAVRDALEAHTNEEVALAPRFERTH